jgi:hypothetical protein
LADLKISNYVLEKYIEKLEKEHNHDRIRKKSEIYIEKRMQTKYHKEYNDEEENEYGENPLDFNDIPIIKKKMLIKCIEFYKSLVSESQKRGNCQIVESQRTVD